jgi:hypothetical protein
MDTITVTVSRETMAKLKKLANEKKITVEELVNFLALRGANNLSSLTNS